MIAYFTKEDFLKQVFDYEKKESWEYQGDLPCIIDFYADWCPPCKVVAPVMEELSKEYEGKVLFFKVDTEQEKQLMEETYKLTQDILRERAVPEGAEAAPTGALYEMSDKELTTNIIKYFQQMLYGDLDEAERTAALIAPFSSKAKEIIDEMALSEVPEPELADINPQVLAGLIKTLRSKIGKK